MFDIFFIVVQVQLSLPTPDPTPLWLCPWVLCMCSLTTLLRFSPLSLPLPLWLLSVCSLFPCLWFYFTCLLVCFVD